MIALLVLFLAPLAAFAQSTITVANPANFRTAVAPSGLATIFGTGLSPVIEQGAPDESGKLPVELGGVQVTIGGTPAGLLYVSPSQINLVIPDDAAIGSAEVTVVAPGSLPLRGSATIRLVAPAIFTLDGTGAGEGAILNAVTYQGAPFLVRTVENGSADKRTRLAVYATGLRWAGNTDRDPSKVNVASRVRAALQMEEGEILALTVEYAGPAPGFAGLDQVNLVLPPEADAAGLGVLTLTVDGIDALAVNVRIDALPEDAIGVASLELSPQQVDGGQTATGRVVLSAPARRTSLAVNLASDDPISVQVPAVVSVAAGQTSRTFSIQTANVLSSRTVQLSASAGGQTASSVLRVRPADAVRLFAMELSAASTTPATTLTGRVVLNRAAPPEGVTVNLSTGQAAVQVPATVSVPFGASSASFEVAVGAAAAGIAAIKAEFDGQTLEQRLEIRAALALELSKKRVVGGTPVTGVVSVAGRAGTGGIVVTLSSSSPIDVRVPASITIPAGSSSATFSIVTQSVSGDATVTIGAQVAGQQATAELELEAETYGIEELSLEPESVAGGSIAVLTVRIRTPLPAPALVTFLSDNMAVARTPISLVLPRGRTTAKVNVATRRVLTPTTVRITANYSGSSKSVELKVQ